MKKLFLIVATSIMSLTLPASGQQQPRPMAPVDILRVANVSDAQIAPDGQWVVYTVSTVDGNETISSLWLARAGTELGNAPAFNLAPTLQRGRIPEWPATTTTATPLISFGWNATNPRWSPDSSKVAFFANHDNQRGIWLVSLSNREPRFIASVQNTNFFITYAGESLAWSPDSKRIAYVSASEEPPETSATPSDDPKVIDRIQYKSRTSFSDNRRTRVWITAIDRSETRQLTSGPFYDHAITFNPNGGEIAFLSNREPDPDANNNSDIFAVDFGGQVRQITHTRGCEYEPAWSPDGKWIAYTATKRDVTTIDSVAEDTHVWVISAAGSSSRELTRTQDRRARSPRWSPDSRDILFLAGDEGITTVFRVPVEGRKIDRLSLFYANGRPGATFDIQNSKFRVGSDSAIVLARPFQISSFNLGMKALPMTERGVIGSYAMPLAFTVSDALHPGEVWFGLGSNVPLHRLSRHNDGLLSSFILQEPEEITAQSFDGMQIQGWLMKPAGWRDDRKYPLILSIHGGPHGMFGWAFNLTFQVYAARGYAVLYLNPRGSSGYGQKFSDGTLNEWGGGDYKDLMAGVDEALKRYSWIDRDRMGVTGGSYGGFMTNWIITQTPRFKAAVANASVSNLVSFYSTSLYQDLIHAEFGGFPWDNYDLLWQWSPLRYVRQAQTPTMFIHGEQDNDVHITQAEEMYMGLKRRGVDTVLVRYPREGHGLREPRHRVGALERTLAWFDRLLK